MSRIVKKDHVAPDIVKLCVDTKTHMAYKAGQAFFLKIGDYEARPYSVANAPDKNSTILEFHIKKSGGLSTYLVEKSQEGDEVNISGPTGDITFNSRCKKPILAIAGGTGLAQIKSICEAALSTDRKTHVHLYHGARSEEDLYMDGYFSEADLNDPHFLYYGVLSDSNNIEPHHRTGLVGDVAANDFEDLSGFRAYICGPAPMVVHTQSLLLEKGIDPKRIHAENWSKD